MLILSIYLVHDLSTESDRTKAIPIIDLSPSIKWFVRNRISSHRPIIDSGTRFTLVSDR